MHISYILIGNLCCFIDVDSKHHWISNDADWNWWICNRNLCFWKFRKTIVFNCFGLEIWIFYILWLKVNVFSWILIEKYIISIDFDWNIWNCYRKLLIVHRVLLNINSFSLFWSEDMNISYILIEKQCCFIDFDCKTCIFNRCWLKSMKNIIKKHCVFIEFD